MSEFEKIMAIREILNEVEDLLKLATEIQLSMSQGKQRS